MSENCTPNTELKANQDKARLTVDCVRQCFDMQDTYGLEPNQLKNRIRGIVEDVRAYDISIIQEALLDWRKSSSRIPTPYDISSRCEKINTKRYTGKKLSEFDGDYTAYKKYLNERK